MSPLNTASHGDATVQLPLDPKTKRTIRYRWHPAVLGLSAFLTALAVLLALGLAGVFVFMPELLELLNPSDRDEVRNGIFLVLIFPFALGIVRILKSAKSKAKGPLATPKHFPEVYAIAAELAAQAGMSKTPTVVVVAGLDTLSNSVQTGGESLILIHSDLLDVSRPNGDMGALKFAIARELGNLAAGHQKISYEFATTVTQSIPYLANLLKWTETYTADRYGAVLAPQYATDYFAVVAVSKDCWLDFSVSQTLDRAGTEKFVNTVAAWMNPTPPLTWRLSALAELGVFSDTYADGGNIAAAKLQKNYGRLFLKPQRITPQHRAELVTDSNTAAYLKRNTADKNAETNN